LIKYSNLAKNRLKKAITKGNGSPAGESVSYTTVCSSMELSDFMMYDIKGQTIEFPLRMVLIKQIER